MRFKRILVFLAQKTDTLRTKDLFHWQNVVAGEPAATPQRHVNLD